jgi:hypothetical protein
VYVGLFVGRKGKERKTSPPPPCQFYHGGGSLAGWWYATGLSAVLHHMSGLAMDG